jgi:hypothetical protein
LIVYPNQKKENQTMSTSSLYRLSGIVLIIAAALTVVSNIALTLFFPNTSPTVPPSDVLSALWSPIGIIGFVGAVLLLFGLVGLYLRQAQQAGIVGLLGFLLTFLGFLFSSIVAGFFFISVLPYLATKGGSAISDGFSTVAPFGLGGGVLLFLGTILLGISIIRAGVFPRLTGIFILVGGILSPAAILGLNLVVSLIGSLSTILLVLGFAWIGSILFSRPEAVAARSSLSSAS